MYGYTPFMNQQQPYGLQQQTYQQPQPQMRMGMAGKYVSDFGEVSANDVPMDGNYATFVKNDMSEIQLRKWNPNGTIETLSYKPFKAPIEPQTVNSSDKVQMDVLNDVRGQIDSVINAIQMLNDKIEKMNVKSPMSNTSKTKKEVADE